MKKDLNQIGVGGNGEVVEAFHQKQHLVIKRTLLRELENSVMPTLDHENLLPWFALVCGERSESRPGQLTCYQIMPKMTEDLSASIRAIGGSVHDHMLNCLQENIPKADISVRAELLRRNTSLVFRGVLEGLDYLHQQELVHRDIKASNILVKRPDACSNSTHTVFTCDCGPQWEVRIADFDSLGQVAVLRERAARRSKRATSGGRGFIKVSTTGTSGYRAPEIFEEFSSSDTNDPQYFSPASDMWAFGGVAIHTVMGFSCPSKQYQFGIMMLADKGMVNKTMKFTKGESEDLISRTLGLHHIREGFPGEKWLDMINFVSRPLKIKPKDRPSAAALLEDPFILHYNPRDTPVQNDLSNPPSTNSSNATVLRRMFYNQLEGAPHSSTGFATSHQPQEYAVPLPVTTQEDLHSDESSLQSHSSLLRPLQAEENSAVTEPDGSPSTYNHSDSERSEVPSVGAEGSNERAGYRVPNTSDGSFDSENAQYHNWRPTYDNSDSPQPTDLQEEGSNGGCAGEVLPKHPPYSPEGSSD
jgi:serine/threonine protein kinase